MGRPHSPQAQPRKGGFLALSTKQGSSWKTHCCLWARVLPSTQLRTMCGHVLISCSRREVDGSCSPSSECQTLRLPDGSCCSFKRADRVLNSSCTAPLRLGLLFDRGIALGPLHFLNLYAHPRVPEIFSTISLFLSLCLKYLLKCIKFCFAKE